MYFTKYPKVAVLALMVIFLAGSGCQDHHFTPFDKMEKHPEISTGEQGKKSSGRAITPQNNPSGAGQGRSGFKGTIVAGMIELAEGLNNKAPAGWALYVIVRSVSGGAPLAVAKAENVTFPFSFRLNEKNIMLGEPERGMSLTLEARYDSDGDLITRDEKDLFGKVNEEFTLGSENVLITLDKNSGRGNRF